MTSVAITEVRITVICCGSSSLDESGPSSLVVANMPGLTEDKVPVLSGGQPEELYIYCNLYCNWMAVQCHFDRKNSEF